MKNEQSQSWILPIVALALSGSMLAYEILLTRIASVLLVSQYVFLVIGLALLGISLGAILEYQNAKSDTSSKLQNPAMWLTWSALTIAAAIVLILLMGKNGGLTLLVLAAMIPFAASGYFFSKMFRFYPQRTGVLYAADLCGAAIGALLVPVLLPAFGAAQSILLISAIVTGIGLLLLLWSRGRYEMLIAGSIFILTAGLWALNQNNRLFGDVPVGNDPNKDLYRLTALEGDAARIVDSRWSTFGRTDLVQFKSDSSMMTIFIDGAAGANMLRFDGLFDNCSGNFTHAVHQFGGILPLLNLDKNQKDNALIIGPGGGRDILLALKAGFKKITAVEINPQVVAIGKDYGNYNGGIFKDSNDINVILAEGRNYLRNSDEQYDLITLFMPITKSSRSLNAFALSESYLFTKEAFGDYRRHLTDEGRVLIMAHGMEEVLKLMTTAIESMQAEGMTVQQAMSRLYVLGSEMMPLFGMQKSPLQPKESEFLHRIAHETMFSCEYSYIPGVEQQLIQPPMAQTVEAGIPMMNPFFIKLASGSFGLSQLERESGYNLLPASDDSPFFLRFDFELPAVVTSLGWISISVLIILFILARRLRKQVTPSNGHFTWWLPVFFASIGIGYIVLELSLFQTLVFYLGDPSRSLALLLAALLIGSGIGSFLSRSSSMKTSVDGGVATSILAIASVLLLPFIFSILHDQSFAIRQAAAAIVMLILGAPMGVMFPIGLRLAKEQIGPAGVPWAWGLNGAASVLGSTLTVAVAMSYGFTWSVWMGAVWYTVATFSAIMLQHPAALSTIDTGGHG